MLEELDRVDWARLNHAYGSAADVPGLANIEGEDTGPAGALPASASYATLDYRQRRLVNALSALPDNRSALQAYAETRR